MPKKPVIQTPGGETEVLLHTCCAPCSSAIIEALLNNGITPIIYYCNPNIYPQEEYEIRKNECTRYAQALGLEIIDDDYDHDQWLEAVKGLENEPERGSRCLKCFKYRLLRTAQYARERGIRLITTTLASSRWKSLDQINEAGLWACEELGMTCEWSEVICGESCVREGDSVESKGISARAASSDFRPTESTLGQGSQQDKGSKDVYWWDRNWRKGGLQERRLQIIKEYDFYNQQYCGCEFSMRKD